MASAATDGDYEAFQNLSQQYQPDIQGPLIRERCPIQDLLAEFSNADPIYIRKIAALPASFSHYRPVRGDGQCGWRAVVFGYFESLMSAGLPKVVSEKARILSFNDTIVAVGYDFSMVELFVEETIELFDSMHDAIESGQASDSFLVDIFNQEGRSDTILFHFRLLAAATMKANPDPYQPYLSHGQSVSEYCQSNIDAIGQEIEQIGLQALTDGVIAPAQINVLVMYLDRSEGNEVTQHHLVTGASPHWPEINLLYRPGHYDMIYRAPPFQIHRTLLPEQEHFVTTDQFDFSAFELQTLLSMNENYSMLGPYSGAEYPPTTGYTSNSFHHFTGMPLAHTTEETSIAAFTSPKPDYNYSTAFNAPPLSLGALEETYDEPHLALDYPSYATSETSCSQYHPPMTLPPQNYTSSPMDSPRSAVSSGQVSEKQELQIRMSGSCYKMGRETHAILPLETSPFKNSPFNRGHFANPDFQPLMWQAEKEYN